MVLLTYEIFTLLSLLVAAVTGFIALRSLRDPEMSYRFKNLFRKDIAVYRNPDIGRFLLYFALISSTFSSALAAFLRLTCFIDMGLTFDLEASGDSWAYWGLTSHIIDGFTFTCLHIIVYLRQLRVYKNDK